MTRNDNHVADAPEFVTPPVRFVLADVFANMREDPVPCALADVERLAVAGVDESIAYVLSWAATSGVNRRTSLDTRPYRYPDALGACSTVRKVSGVPRPSLRLGFLCGQVLVAVLLLVGLKQDPQ